MQVKSRLKDYHIFLKKDTDFIKVYAAEKYSQFVIDRKVYELYKEIFSEVAEDRILLIDAREENKSMETVLQICEKMSEISAKRNVHLISFGGGIIQDITGFAANILYRGIKWTFVPTTLLAACDSCIGGKTSLNYQSYKNLLGTFYPPDEIYICSDFFKTLSQRDFESGMGEVVKFNLMAGEEGLEYIEKRLDKLLKREKEEINICVRKSLEFKKRFIEIDEFDRGERIKLNFAHTFGHAIETTTDYEIPHGTAVAIGMIMANSISVKRGILEKEFAKRSKEILLKVIHVGNALERISIESFINSMRKDKKQIGRSLTAVLLKGCGEELEIFHDVTEKEVEYAMDDFKNSYFS